MIYENQGKNLLTTASNYKIQLITTLIKSSFYEFSELINLSYDNYKRAAHLIRH